MPGTRRSSSRGSPCGCCYARVMDAAPADRAGSVVSRLVFRRFRNPVGIVGEGGARGWRWSLRCRRRKRRPSAAARGTRVPDGSDLVGSFHHDGSLVSSRASQVTVLAQPHLAHATCSCLRTSARASRNAGRARGRGEPTNAAPKRRRRGRQSPSGPARQRHPQRQVGGGRSRIGEDRASVGPLLEPGNTRDEQHHRAGHLPDDQEEGQVAQPPLHNLADIVDSQDIPRHDDRAARCRSAPVPGPRHRAGLSGW
jgi:hypothetical protein